MLKQNQRENKKTGYSPNEDYDILIRALVILENNKQGVRFLGCIHNRKTSSIIARIKNIRMRLRNKQIKNTNQKIYNIIN